MDDLNNDYVTFLTTASCNGKCRYCSVRPWMEKHKGYQMPLQDVVDFVFYSRESGYKYKQINFGGGEPFLWGNILSAAEIIQNGNITESIVVNTNGLLIDVAHKAFISELSRLVSRIQISRYIGNESNVLYGVDNFEKVTSVPQVRRPITPTKPVPGTLPAKCQCIGRGFAHGEVSICAPARSMGGLESGIPLKQSYLSEFGDERENQACCQVCVGNVNIHPHIKWYENEVLNG